MRWIIIILFMFLSCGCQRTTPSAQTEQPLTVQEQHEEQAIEVVQKSPSAVEGQTVVECLSGILKQSQKMGNRVRVLGWESIANKDGYDDVLFRSLQNDLSFDFHWKVKGQKVIPADDATAAVMKKRPVKI